MYPVGSLVRIKIPFWKRWRARIDGKTPPPSWGFVTGYLPDMDAYRIRCGKTHYRIAQEFVSK